MTPSKTQTTSASQATAARTRDGAPGRSNSALNNVNNDRSRQSGNPVPRPTVSTTTIGTANKDRGAHQSPAVSISAANRGQGQLAHRPSTNPPSNGDRNMNGVLSQSSTPQSPGSSSARGVKKQSAAGQRAPAKPFCVLMNDITDSDNHAWLKVWAELSKIQKDWDFHFIAEGRQFDPRFFTKETDTKKITGVLKKCEYTGLGLVRAMLRGTVDSDKIAAAKLTKAEHQIAELCQRPAETFSKSTVFSAWASASRDHSKLVHLDILAAVTNPALPFKAYFYEDGLSDIKEVFNPKVHYHEELVARTKEECLEFGKIIDETAGHTDPEATAARVQRLRQWYVKARNNRLAASFGKKDPLQTFDMVRFTQKVESAPWTIVFSGASATLFGKLQKHMDGKWFAKHGSKICWLGQGGTTNPAINIATSPYNHALNPTAFQSFMRSAAQKNGGLAPFSQLIPTDTIQRFFFDFDEVAKWDKDLGLRVGLYNTRSKPTSYDLLAPSEIENWKPGTTPSKITIKDYDQWRDDCIKRLKDRHAISPIRGNIADLAAFWTVFFSWPQFGGRALIINPTPVLIGTTGGGDVRPPQDDKEKKGATLIALLPKEPNKDVDVKSLDLEFGPAQIQRLGQEIRRKCEEAVRSSAVPQEGVRR